MNFTFCSALFFNKSAFVKTGFNGWKVLAAALFLLCLAFSASASAQTAQWVKQMGTGGISNGVSTDAAGNVYATGTISNPGLFDDITVPCNASDVFLTKNDSNGNILWATVGGGALLDQGNDVATDANGNSYVAGAIQTNGPNPTARFGNFTLTGHGDYDWLIVKYDTLGNVVWAKNYGSTLGDIAQGVALDSAGNIYVTGFFSSTMTVEGVTATSKGLFDVFLAKFDPNGTLLWLKTAGGTGSDIAHGVVADSTGNVGIVGEFQNTATFDSRSVRAAGLGDAFVAKYDSAGNNLWVHSGGSTTSFAVDPGKAIGVDAANNFYITGDYTGTATFDGLSVPNTGTSGTDIFIAKYNTTGAIQWLHHAGGPVLTRAIASGSIKPAIAGSADSPGAVPEWFSTPSRCRPSVTNISSWLSMILLEPSNTSSNMPRARARTSMCSIMGVFT